MADLPEKARIAMDALLAGETISKAAKRAQINRKTLAKLLHENPEFRAQMAKARDAIRSAVIDRILDLQHLALDTLAAVCRAKNIDAQTKVAAARAILQAGQHQAPGEATAAEPVSTGPTRTIEWRLIKPPDAAPAAGT